ncbi:angiopoietin-related protein 5-like [Bombina bombina]|uniref:angiopoietin-related protein 5-like n=1 Tax=Bombina bombina TaxID=8345 RepID=UPI00235A4B29|nr:angiopoietin-related protein 5-like [Bombina bombina]
MYQIGLKGNSLADGSDLVGRLAASPELPLLKAIIFLWLVDYHQHDFQSIDQKPVGFQVKHMYILLGLRRNAQGYDCSHIKERNNSSASGIYTIKPIGAKSSFQVFCEMRDDGGWTVIQKHNGNDGLSFDRTWAEYKMGFGNISKEHWLGLENMKMLTNQADRTSELLISLWEFGGSEAFAFYSTFKVGLEINFYQLSVGNYFGNAGDAFKGDKSDTNENGSFFSSKDKDNDKCNPCSSGDLVYKSCSNDRFHSGWWFNRCGIANLNGQWRPKGLNKGWASAVHWQTWRKNESLKSSMMYLRHH